MDINNDLSKENQTSDTCGIEKLYLRQISYADIFRSTSKFLEEQGLYKKIVDFADFSKNGETIIDVGCGDCRLIRHIKDSNPKATIIGVDINSPALMIGNEILETFGYKVNLHYGINIAKDPDTKKLTLISDIMTEDIPYNFVKGKINLLQEDFRFGEILRERLEEDVGLADVITYTMPGGFSPHIIFEKGEKDYNAVRAGVEMNQHVMALGLELLKNNGRMIWAIRVGSQNVETLKHMNIDDLNLSMFKSFYNINRTEVVRIDEQKQKLELPAYAIGDKAIHYTDDIRKMKHDFKIAILLIEMTKKARYPFI